MASSSMSSASGSFGRLLKSSKVVSHYDPSIPLVYTSHGGSKKRSAYGLKRALPKIKTAAIRVHSLDNSMTKLTDFSYAAREHCFVQAFKESNVKIAGPATSRNASSLEDQRSRLRAVGQPAGGCAWDKKNFQSIEELKKKAKAGAPPEYVQQDAATLAERAKQGFEALLPSASSQGSGISSSSEGSSAHALSSAGQFPEDYLHMSEADFRNFLKRLQKLQAKFQEYLRLNSKTQETSPKQVQQVMLRSAQDAANTLGLIDDFLAKEMPALKAGSTESLHHDPKLNHIESLEHIALGLTYAAPNLYMSDQATRTLPLRLIDHSSGQDSKGSAFEGGRGHPVASLGLVTHLKQNEAPKTATAWHVDDHGDYNLINGRGLARVEHAYIKPPFALQKAASPDETLYGVEVSEIDNASKRQTIVDENVVKVNLYRAGEGKGSLRPTRIGSQEWVTVQPARPMMEGVVRGGDVTPMFYNSGITPPRPDRFKQDGHIPGRKSQDANSENRVDKLIQSLQKFQQTARRSEKK